MTLGASAVLATCDGDPLPELEAILGQDGKLRFVLDAYGGGPVTSGLIDRMHRHGQTLIYGVLRADEKLDFDPGNQRHNRWG